MRSLRWILSAIWLVGCAENIEPTSFQIDDPDEESLGEELEVDEDPTIYALKEVFSIEVQNPNPLSGKWGYQTTTSWKRLDWERSELDVEWTEELCGIYVTEIFGTKTAFPKGFVDTMPTRSKTGSLSESTIGAEFLAGSFADLNGVALDDPFTDSLPSSSEHPAVVDQDSDGNPGITVNIDNDLMGKGDVYAIQRNITSYAGTVVSEGRIEGFVSTQGEQVTVGASSWWLETEAVTRDDSDPTHSYFIIVDVDDLSCDEIIEQRYTIF